MKFPVNFPVSREFGSGEGFDWFSTFRSGLIGRLTADDE
jgi:hypothetical protein